jgi:cytochrome d ubiquinol oxidase subunit I
MLEMSDLIAARSQMAMSLAFHIVFAAVGIAMPLLMAMAEWRWLRTGDGVYLELAKRWAKGTAIMFAVGAVSGTVLSFELGLLWPEFMHHAGAIIGMPFSLEGFAFFFEAIFLGIYLYGWDRVPPRIHWITGVLVFIGGTFSGIFVMSANAWMNTPAGFRVVDGELVDIEPFKAMFNPGYAVQATHMLVAVFLAVGFAIAAIHAVGLLRHRESRFHRKAFVLAFGMGTVAALLQPISGDFSARMVAEVQPVKLAAMEGQWETERGAALRIGGWPDEETETTRWSIEIPKALSLLAHHDPDAEIVGLKAVPASERPPVAIVHVAFQIMVGCGFALLGVGLLGAFLAWRGRPVLEMPWFLKLVVLVGPLGFIAIEAGWTVTEVGRQPWIIQGVMKTAESVTPMPNLIVPFLGFTALYIVLGLMVILLLRRTVITDPLGADQPGGSEPPTDTDEEAVDARA